MTEEQKPKKTRKRVIDTDWHEPFLRVLAINASVSEACKAAKVLRKVAYAHRERDPEFKAAWEEALEIGIESLELVAMKRAKSKSDLLVIFLLKAHKRAFYGDPKPTDKETDEAIERAMKQLRERETPMQETVNEQVN